MNWKVVVAIIVLLLLLLLWVGGGSVGLRSDFETVVISASHEVAVNPPAAESFGEEESEEVVPTDSAATQDPASATSHTLTTSSWTCQVNRPFVDVEARGPWWKGPWGKCKSGPCQVEWSLTVSGSDAKLAGQITPKALDEQGECRTPKGAACPDDDRGRGIRRRLEKNAKSFGPILFGSPVTVSPRRAGSLFKNEAPRDGKPDTVDTPQYTWWYIVDVSIAKDDGSGNLEFDPANIVCTIDPRVCVRKNGQMVCQEI